MYGRVATEEEGDHEISLKDRHSCTDLPCCLLFLLSVATLGGLYGFAVVQTGGSMGRLFHGIDSQGQICGVDRGVVDKPLLFWCVGVRPGEELLSGDLASALALGRRVCVSECPGSSDDKVQECTSPGNSGTKGTNGSAAIMQLDGYATKSVLHRYCVPDLEKYGDAAKEVLSSQLGGSDERAAELISSIPSAWPAILGALVLAVFLGYMHLCLVRCCAEVLLWMCILLTVAGFAALGGFLWCGVGPEEVPADRLMPTAAMQSRLLSSVSNGTINGTAVLEEVALSEEQMYRGGAIVCWSLSALALCLACFLRSSIDAAAACMEVACEAIFEMPTLLIAPIVKTIVKGALFVGLFYGFLLLWTIGDPESFDLPLPTVGEAMEDSPHISHDTKHSLAILFYLLVAFWILGFVTALYEFVVAYAVATYYYTPLEQDEDGGGLVDEKDVEGCCAALEGFRIGLVYHSGSFAFGSFLIATLHVVQKLIEYAQLKNKEAGDNQVVACVLCICGCCIYCLQEIVGFINRNAYIDMAINSNSFCAAAKGALEMVIQLGDAMAILNGATYVFAVFGTMLITVACSAGTYVAVGYGPFADPSSMFFVEDPLAAAIVAVIVAIPISLAFMDVFDMASDTLLYCYGEDLRTGKEDHHNHHAPLGLRELLERYGHDSGQHSEHCHG